MLSEMDFTGNNGVKPALNDGPYALRISISQLPRRHKFTLEYPGRVVY